MDERQFRRAVNDLSDAVALYDEDVTFAALGVIADRFNWEIAKRDPGPPEENDEFWTDEECVDPDCSCHLIERGRLRGKMPEWASLITPQGRDVVRILMGRELA